MLYPVRLREVSPMVRMRQAAAAAYDGVFKLLLDVQITSRSGNEIW
jgi:hypothetical protein